MTPALTAARPEVRLLSRPPWVDVALAGAFVAMTVAEALFNPRVQSPWHHVLVAGLALTTLAWRRQYPLAVATVIIAANIVTNPTSDFATILSLVLVSFTLGSETEGMRSYLGLAVVLLPFLTASVIEGLEPSDLAAALVFLVGPWAVGGGVRQRSAHASAALQRAEQLEREQAEHEERAARAVEQERTRIARELHDIVSHSLSVVTIQTQAVRRRLGPEQQREVDDLAAVEATAREALAEMRRLFGVLRTDGEAASLSPQPGLDDLDRLVTKVRGSGLEVDLVTEGTVYPLPPGVDLAAYRIVQEGLTNTLRHAGAARAVVTVTYGPTTVDVTVDDDGHGMPAAGSPRDAPAGHGLVGVRERVHLYGGTLDLSPGPLGGARLQASLPVREAR